MFLPLSPALNIIVVDFFFVYSHFVVIAITFLCCYGYSFESLVAALNAPPLLLCVCVCVVMSCEVGM